MRSISTLGLLALHALSAQAAPISVPMQLIDGQSLKRSVGQVTVTESAYGLVFTPDLEGLPPGIHGFHVHEHPSCAPGLREGQPVAGLAAGGHLDPLGSKRHGSPWDAPGNGHLGDLPGLVVTADGRASYPLLAPRLKLADLRARSLMVHIGGDNHADHPMPMGGGGARMACGVTPSGAPEQ